MCLSPGSVINQVSQETWSPEAISYWFLSQELSWQRHYKIDSLQETRLCLERLGEISEIAYNQRAFSWAVIGRIFLAGLWSPRRRGIMALVIVIANIKLTLAVSNETILL